MVVPMLAPIITPTDWLKFIMPALTRPTTITVVALLLWIIAVIAVPTKTAKNLFRVRTSSSFFILSPAAFCKASDITFMPYRNMAKPANKPSIIL
ncbi:hypothetical protein SDC9_117363 [bioreactor metagenome]|uniref:Uncharacterized protein n=1 Tax=bioreactor metagenome TaxID=1076179 RepID=A0A645BZ80_9ZZZZ